MSKGYVADDLTTQGYVRQYRRFNNLYGVPWRLDFYIIHTDKFPDGMAIESKWQSSGGSADEKLFFAFRSLEALPIPGVLIIGGNGARKCAVDWCLREAENHTKVTVLTGMDDLIKWAQKSL